MEEKKEPIVREGKVEKIIMPIVLCIAGVLLLGLSFYAGIKYANHEDKKETKTEEKEGTKTEEIKEEVKELALDDNLVKDARLLVPRVFCHGMAIDFNNKNRTVADLSDTEKLAITTSYLSKDLDLSKVPAEDYTGEVHKEITEEDVKKLFEDTSFLKSLKNYKEQQYGIGISNIYYKGEKLYVNMIATGCIAEEYEDDTAYLIKAEKQGDKLMLTYAYAYVSSKFNTKIDNFENKIYKAKGDTTPVVVNPEYDAKKDMYDMDYEKLDHYIFIIDTANGNMRLQEIQYVPAK